MPDATIMAGTISLFINPSFTLSEDRRVEQFLKEHNSEEKVIHSRVAKYDKEGRLRIWLRLLWLAFGHA